MCFFVVDDVTEFIFLEGLDLHQDDVANDRVVDVRVVKRLIWIVYRFRVNSGSVFRVVFDLDGDVTANRFDEDAVFNRNVWMQAAAMLFTGRSLPLEVMLWRILDFMIAAIVDVLQTLVFDEELERLDVGQRFARAEHKVKVRSRNVELRETGVFVVFVECFKVDFELLIAEQIE